MRRELGGLPEMTQPAPLASRPAVAGPSARSMPTRILRTRDLADKSRRRRNFDRLKDMGSEPPPGSYHSDPRQLEPIILIRGAAGAP
jgi:hypothetical protein